MTQTRQQKKKNPTDNETNLGDIDHSNTNIEDSSVNTENETNNTNMSGESFNQDSTIEDNFERDEEEDRNVRPRNNPVPDLDLKVYENGNPTHSIHQRYVYQTVKQMFNPTVKPLMTKVVGRLLRITNSKDGQASSNTYTYKFTKKSDKTASKGSFRLLLFQDLFSTTGDVFYVKVNNTKRQEIWSKIINERDSGPLSIGCILVFLGSNPIKDVFCNDIVILPTSGSSILMYEPDPDVLPNIWPQFELTDTNKTNAFQIKAKLEMINVSVKQSNCIGLFCDRQNLDENNNTYGCGCYTSADTRHAKLVLNFYLQIKMGDTVLEAQDYTSHKFTQNFIKTPFQSTTNYNEWDSTDAFFDLVDRIENIIAHVNRNGEWKVIGWCKRGEIEDKNFVEETQKVQSADVNRHITTIFPYNMNDENLKRAIDQLKYDNTNA